MPDLKVLKQRVEDTEQRLLSAQHTRERECDALMDMWLQIKERFQAQEHEIASYRHKVAALQDANVELTTLIDSMLGRIEGSVTESTDETVPRIAGMAKDLLDSEPIGDTRIDDRGKQVDHDTEEPLILDPIVESEIVSPGPSIRPEASRARAQAATQANGHATRHHGIEPKILVPREEEEILELTEAVQTADISSPGIRSLISRIERAVNRSSNGSRNNGRSNGGEVDSELEEIEHLRNELNGLRERISTTGPAE